MAGTFLLVMSLSGSILVFHDDIDRAFFKDQLTLQQPVRGLSFDASFEKIRTDYPGWEIRVPAFPREGEALKYELRKGNFRKWLFVHPETGQLLSTADRADQRFVNVLLTFHYSFFAGTPGKVFVLILGVAFLVMLVTGIVLYRKSIVKVFLFRQHFSSKSRRAFYSSIHRLLGVWGLAFNILLCVTAIRIAYVVASAGIQATDAQVNVPRIAHSIDTLLSQAAKMHPEFQVTYLRFPSAAEGKLLLLGRLRSDPSYYGRTYSNIAVNCQTGAIDGITLLRDKPFVDRILTVLQPLHFGDYAGIWVKLLYTIGGLLPGILAVSGFMVWRQRNRSTTPSRIRHVKHQTHPVQSS